MPDSKRNGSRPEFEIAWYTKELGKELQREMLQKQLALLSEGSQATSIHPRMAAPAARADAKAATDSTPEPPESST
ncbi:MAG TPA: hypothetical protein VFE74_00140 [Ramlibacter sp.]|jgi:hypothetical protein|nr:hypothetical protein [Ramlibacter sp.]